MQLLEGNYLNLWNICREGTNALGPGLRYVIWTQGCLKRCIGCTSPESWPIEPNMIVEVERIAEDITKRLHLSGITISGGEPFLQAASLTKLLLFVKRQRPLMTVIVFTGYRMEQLVWSDAQALLTQIDVLIDGPYDRNKKANRGLRGSSNQRIIFLSEALDGCRDELENGPRKIEMQFSDDEIVTIGIPNSKLDYLIDKKK